jgi:hypothetical protein
MGYLVDQGENQSMGVLSMVNLIEGSLSAFAGRIGLTKTLLWTFPFPWVICFVVFAMFHFTYPKDAACVHALMASRHGDLPKAYEAKGGTPRGT